MKNRILLTGLLILAGLAGAAEPLPSGTDSSTDDLVPSALISEAGWNRNWQRNLPLKAGEQVASLMVTGPHLYVLTNTNILFCIDRKKGRVQSASQLSARHLPVCKPLYYEDQFWFIVGSEVMAFDPAAADFSLRRKFPQVGSSSECGLARNTKNIYIGGSDSRLYAINTDGYWQQFTATADNDSAIVSLLATDEIVVFATQAGNVVGMNPNEAQRFWQFDATGQISSGQLVQDGDAIYVGSLDSKLYKLNLSDGKLAWKTPFHSGAPIRDTFTVGAETVYLYNALNGLYGVNKKTGKSIWQVRSGKSMICETPQKGFVLALPGIVKVMDNHTGAELFSVNFSSVEMHAINTVDAVMYLADKTGRLMSVSVQ